MGKPSGLTSSNGGGQGVALVDQPWGEWTEEDYFSKVGLRGVGGEWMFEPGSTLLRFRLHTNMEST